MANTAGDVKTRVQRTFGDEAGSQVTAADVYRWINDAQREIAIANDLLQVKGTKDAVASDPTYSLPTDILKLLSVKYNGINLRALNLQEADEIIGTIDQTVAQGYPTGTPTHYWIFAGEINLYPAPDAALTGGIQIYYLKQPTEVTGDADDIGLPVEYFNRVVEYCLAQAYELDENYEAAQTKLAQFKAGVAELSQNEAWEQQEFYPHITSLPDVAYDSVGYWY